MSLMSFYQYSSTLRVSYDYKEIALNNLQIRREAEKELTEKNLPSLELIDKINQLIKEYYRDQE